MSDFSILAENLTYSYGDHLAVDHISFAVSEGEIFGFLGPNGAGKSTAIRMLTGQLRPKEGKAIILGTDVAQHPNKVQQHIGVAFETANRYEQMSAEENLIFFARLFGVQIDVRKLLVSVGLDNRGKARVEGFSKGMKQRLMVARALVNRPRILFLDEPTDGLDPVSSESIRSLILETRANGTTVFLTTHDMYEADKLSDRVAFIDRGKIVALDRPARLKQQYGKRTVRVETLDREGIPHTHEIGLDGAETSEALRRLMQTEQIVTMHSEEATLEDIFIKITGKGLV